MNIRGISGLAGVIALAVVSSAQTPPTRFLPLQKDPPKEMLSASPIGLKPAKDVLHISVSLQPRSLASLQAYADSVSDPKSSNYRQFLTPEEVGSRFGLPISEINAVKNYLTSQGMTIRLIGKNRLSILADATVDQVQKAFHTTIQQFSVASPTPGKREVRYSFTNSPELPSRFALEVQNIGGLENFTRPRKHMALTPTQLKSVYSLASIYNGGSQGQGRTIGISNYDGFRLPNVSTLCNAFNPPVPTGGAGSNITVEPVGRWERVCLPLPRIHIDWFPTCLSTQTQRRVI